MNVIAFYLPQFHAIPENDEWWGKGFTEWVNVKKGSSLFEGHYQPRVPLNNNYYCLLDKEKLAWQAELAKEYGIYGFCIYHYWFGGHKLLEKPLELLLQSKDINTHYCICWANEDWTTQWVSGKPKTLIAQNYGQKTEWEEHYRYLSQFFHDERYIKTEGKPVVVIYRPELIPCLNEMLDFWQELAKKDGFTEGLSVGYQHVYFALDKDKDDSRLDFQIDYQPWMALSQKHQGIELLIRTIKRKVFLWIEKIFHKSLDLTWRNHFTGVMKFDYEETWKRIVSAPPLSNKSIPGAFVDWDNTCRKGVRGSVAVGASPTIFKKYFKKLLEHARQDYKKDTIFIFAWNEWGEAGYLEPDEKFKYCYLQAIKESLKEDQENS